MPICVANAYIRCIYSMLSNVIEGALLVTGDISLKFEVGGEYEIVSVAHFMLDDECYPLSAIHGRYDACKEDNRVAYLYMDHISHGRLTMWVERTSRTSISFLNAFLKFFEVFVARQTKRIECLKTGKMIQPRNKFQFIWSTHLLSFIVSGLLGCSA